MSLIGRLKTSLGVTLPPSTDNDLSADWPPRPDGAMMWLHCPSHVSLALATAFANTLHAALNEDISKPVNVVITRPEGTDKQVSHAVQILRAPPDKSYAVGLFIAHWRPDWALWLAPDAPETARMRRAVGIPAALCLPPMDTLPPEALLREFNKVLPEGPNIRRRLVEETHRDVPMADGGVLASLHHPLPVNSSELDEISTQIAGRPTWLAILPKRAELGGLLTAQRQASAHANKLLTIIMVPEGEGPHWAQTLREKDLRVAERDAEGVPDQDTDVFIAEGPDEAGLWLRVAPACWFADPDGENGISAMDAAALGSAAILGPVHGPIDPNLLALDAAGALTRIGSTNHLGAALASLLIPETAAQKALAGWKISSLGAPLLNAVCRQAHRALDLEDQPDAAQAAPTQSGLSE